MLKSFPPIQDGLRHPSLSVNEDMGDSSSSDDDEKSRLLSNLHHRAELYSVPGPEGADIQVEVPNVKEETHSQNSIITIFSMWNTMMGTSLLSMPWAVKQAGFANGIVLLLAMAGLMTYTSYRVLTSCKSMAGDILAEFSDAVRHHLGRIAEILAVFCSLITFLGGCIVYWILMSNFLYHIGVFIYHHVTTAPHHINGSEVYGVSKYSDVICNNDSSSSDYESSTFEKAWDETKTLPFYLIAILFPLLNFKSPTFFTKFNALGTLSVTYLTIFVAVKAGQWGINLDFNSAHSAVTSYSPNFEWSFPALTGVAALAYFLQNSIVAIVRNQRHPENNTRDLIIAYVLVCLTYTYMGVVFYMSFPLSKSCIEDNFLNNIASTDIMAFVARIGLFFQMTCVLPLLLFIIRAQFLGFVCKAIWPSLKHVLALNIFVVAVCVVFAVFLPKIGHIIGFVGAFAGFSYAIALPCLVYLVSSYREGTLTVFSIIFHSFLVFIGLANFVSQFVIIGHTK